MNSGILAINKPKDWTSFDVVNKIKHMVRPLKVGHLGTLDPMATGVLLVTIGKATKLFNLMQEKKKRYLATFEFGRTTDTLDSTGIDVDRCEYTPTREELENVLPNFIGEIDQVPPKYSAKSINGERAYDLARQNIDFELKSKTITIYDIKIVSFTRNVLTLDITCGSGTYIRSIGRDIANELNTLAVMTNLIRTNIDRYSLTECCEIADINQENIKLKLIDLNDIIDYPRLILDEVDTKKILNGQTLIIDKPDGNYKLNEGSSVLAIVKLHKKHAKMSLFLAK